MEQPTYNFSIPQQGIGIDCEIKVNITIKGGEVTLKEFKVEPLLPTELNGIAPAPAQPLEYIQSEKRVLPELKLTNFNNYAKSEDSESLESLEELEELEEFNGNSPTVDTTRALYVVNDVEKEIIDAINTHIVNESTLEIQQESTVTYYSFFMQRSGRLRHERLIYLRRSKLGIVMFIRKECLKPKHLRMLNLQVEVKDFYVFEGLDYEKALDIIDITKPGILEFCNSLVEEDTFS